ncbi:hypothetical protein KUD97_02805 [Desulfovibrio desulfuricans]|uniref:hypothetical protein n=1 Tax=Desulfovibrio desulfuricans TaxID=876 RepID=UPI001F276AE8|nr:hypothetical protein [Desulfovibrio desulfuricans]UIB00610.1 hypothetical protein KUD97_02805 [Desulfovibrio desulfuricans]
MTILPVTESDLPQILALQKAAFESEARLVENWDIPPLTQTLEELVEEWRVGVMLKALDGQTLAGTVRAHHEKVQPTLAALRYCRNGRAGATVQP